MIKYRTVLLIKCDDPNCQTAGRYEGEDHINANRQALNEGWVTNLNTGRHYCREHRATAAARVK